ncbi:MAG: chemotaxis response regulator protein-glutamate methylesterase [Gammaproteobacteria bacterium]
MSIRILVVDDSIFYQHRLKEMLDAHPSLEVIGVALDGKEAIEKTKALKPDVITMDIEMPVMDGISAVKEIMRDCPTPVLMISAVTKQGAKATFEAMDAGALDFLTKDFHEITEDHEAAGKKICNKILDIAGNKTKISKQSTSDHKRPNKAHLADYKILAIGASTGGPVAVQKVLKGIPKNFPLPILIAQHMPGTFTPMFSERLNEICEITIKEAEDGDVLFPECAYIAPGGKQTTVITNGRQISLRIEEGDPLIAYKPSINKTFESLSDIYQEKVLALILTGMGSDGCEGARKLKQSGSKIWAQDEESSVVYGMPMAVAKAGLTDQIMSIDSLAKAFSSEKHISESLAEGM